MVVAAGASAHAASPVTTLKNYTASATSQSLGISVQLNPQLTSVLNQVGGTLNGVLAGTPLAGAGDLLGGISENISYATANAAFDRKSNSVEGSSIGQTFSGTLDTLVGNVLKTLDSTFDVKVLQGARTLVNKASTTGPVVNLPIKSLAIPSATMPIVKIGIGDQLASVATQVTSAISNGHSDLASIDVSLAPLVSALDASGAPVSSTLNTLTQTVNGLIGQINAEIKPVLQSAGLTNLLGQLTVPGLPDLTQVSILHVGIMDAVSNTSVDHLAQALSNGATEMRRAHAVNQLAGIDILGGLVHIDALTTTADAALDNLAAHPSANADVRILGLKVGNLPVNVSLDKIQIGSQTIDLGSTLSNTLNTLVNNVAGVTIQGPSHTTSTGPGVASADAQSLRISVAPSVGGQTLFDVNLTGPHSTATVGLVTTQVEGKTVFTRATTGLNDHMYVIYGLVFLAGAVLVRRFALSR
jgi:hypothetical protein